MSFVVAALLLQSAAPLPIRHDPIKDWNYRRKEVNARSGVEEVSAEISGEEATPIDLTRGREVFEVRGVRAVYYMEPRPPKTTKVERIFMTARRARMDNAAGVLLLEEAVRVEKPGLDGAPPSILTAPEARVTFHPEFVCARCGLREAAKGSCPVCRQPLHERAAISVIAPRDFELAGPDGTIRGERLAADEGLSEMAVERHGFLEVVGDPQNVGGGRSGPPRALISQLACRGPLRISETAPGRRTVSASDGVRLERVDPSGTQTAFAERMRISLGSRLDPASGRSSPVIERVEAGGDVRLWSASFAEGREVAARAEEMTLERGSFDDFELTRVLLEGAPVEVRSGATYVRATRVSLEQPFGAATFEGNVDARVHGLAGNADAPVLLRSRRLAARLSPRGDDVESLEANGDVRLEGLGGAGGAGRAAAERFVYDRASGRGLLEAPRAVRLELGSTRVLAPVVALMDAGRVVLLQGPKRVVFSQERDGRRDELVASCEGDILYDAGAGRMRMSRACRLRTPDFRLEAERVDVQIDPERRELKAFTAREDVRVRRDLENVLLSGDRLYYDPERREFRLRGTPFATATRDRSTMTTEEIVLTERVEPDGRRVPMTELRGGERGVRMRLPAESK